MFLSRPRSFWMVWALILARSAMFEYHMNSLGLQCNIQLHDLPVAFVLNIIGTASGWAEVILSSSGVNASWLGWFSNVFNNYTSVLGFQDCNAILWIVFTVIVILNIMRSVLGWTWLIITGLDVINSQSIQISTFSIIMQMCWTCKVKCMAVNMYHIVLKNMGSVSRWTKAIPEGPDVNPGCLGQFSNIFNNYASLLCLQCNTHVNKRFWLL